ncbi:hypothetical protein HYT56_05390 [Candidatus Woesearchaeota archaeon]|nr:hypothetical protein [Candidatus Woesearchaeota archaeon]
MKKGMSEIISAVLLIVLITALISVVITFSRRSIERGFEEGQEIFEGFSSCEEVKFFIENAECGKAGNEDGKINKDLLYIGIKNEKNINFRDAFVVKFLLGDGSTEISSTLDDTRLNAYEVKLIGIYRPFVQGDFGKVYKEFNTIEIIPRVKAGDEFQFCENKKKEVEVKNCAQ